MLTTGSVVGAATTWRIGAASGALVARRSMGLAGLALRASLGGPGASTAQSAFRDEVLSLARDSAEESWRQMRRGLDELDAATRRGDPPAARPVRPYRVKP